MGTTLDGMCNAYVETCRRRIGDSRVTHLLRVGDKSQPSEDPPSDQSGYFVDAEFDGLCRALAVDLKGRTVEYGGKPVVVARVTIRHDGATIQSASGTAKITDLGRKYTFPDREQ